jgi:hypothetical protein
MANIYDLSDTWADGATTFTAIKMSVTDSASAAASLLMDLQVGGVSAFSVDKAARASFGSASFRLGGPDVAGATATITASASTDLITWSSHGLVTGSPVQFSNSGGALPGGIVATATYYAVVNDANSFKIATTYNFATAATPTTVNITTDGTGTNTARAARVLQSMFAQNFTGTDALGAPLLFNGSQGTGSGPGGSIIFRTASAGTTGSSANRLTDLMVLNAPSRTVDIHAGLAGDSVAAFRIFNSAGVQSTFFSTNGVNNTFQWSLQYLNVATSAAFGSGADVFFGEINFRREAANTLAQRNGVNAQASNLYSTYTSATNFQRMAISSARVTLSALTGASATAAALIPDGAVVVGVTARVTTEITGSTGFLIGTAGDTDRWGDITGTAVGTTSDNTNWTAGTIECFTAATDVVITEKTANFTAGAIEIAIHYLRGEAD